MTAPDVTLAAVLIVTGLACLVVAVIVWKSARPANTVQSLTVLLAAGAGWNLSYAMYWIGVPDPTGHDFFAVSFVAVSIMAPAALVFAARFTGSDQWLTKSMSALLTAFPLVVSAFIVTSSFHGLYFVEDDTGRYGASGLVFWVATLVCYVLVGIAMILLWNHYRSTRGVFRIQARTVFLGIVAVVLSSLSSDLGLTKALGFEITPIVFAVVAILFTYTLLHSELLTLTPFARHILVDRLPEGVLVLDLNDRLTDINAAAPTLLGLRPVPVPGTPLSDLAARNPALVTGLADVKPHDFEMKGPHGRLLQVQVFSVDDRSGLQVGRMVLITDVTEIRSYQAELLALSRTDPLTGVGNRRMFDELGAREVAAAVRSGSDVSAVLVDIDYLKTINDQGGHAAGDEAIQAVAAALNDCVRFGDIVARIGGDEFAMILPSSTADEAQGVIKRIRDLLAGSSETSISVGVAQLPAWNLLKGLAPSQVLACLVASADDALYVAKQSGRGVTKVSDSTRQYTRAGDQQD